MSNDLLQIANQRIAELQQEIDELETFKRTLSRLASFANQRDRPISPLAAMGRRSSGESILGKIEQRLAETNVITQREKIERAVSEILTKQAPMTTAQLLADLVKRGITLGGTEPERNLSVYLSRSNHFEMRRKDGGWFLRNKEKTPEGGNLTGDSLV
ncbi:hypothetical protein [Thiomonas sp.]